MSLVGILLVAMVITNSLVHGRNDLSTNKFRDSCSHLKGKVLSVVGTGRSIFLDFDPHTGKVSGRDIDILEILSKKIGFKYTFESINMWGIKTKNGSWNGVIGQVKSRMADIGISQRGINYERYKAINFTRPITLSSFCFVTKKPKKLPQHFNLIKPFGYPMWLLIISASTLITVTFTISSPHSSGNAMWLLIVGSLTENMNFNILTMQPCYKLKWLLLLWMLFSSLIIHSYECNLKANLVNVQYESPINSAADLLLQEKHLYLFINLYQHSIMERSSKNIFKRLYEDTVKHNTFLMQDNLSDEFQQELWVLEGGNAVIMDEFRSNDFFDHVKILWGNNPFRRSNEHIEIIMRGFVVGDATLKSCLDEVLKYLFDSGISVQIFKRNGYSFKESKESTKDEPLRMDQLLFAWIILLMGMLLSGFMLYLEIIYHPF